MFKRKSDFLNNLTFRSTTNTLNSKSEYQRLDEFCYQNDEQLEVFRRPIPWKAIILALFLFIIGSAIIIMSCLIFTGFIVNIKPTDGLLVLLLLGFVMFIPGFYHCRIAYYAYHKYPGFAFEEIPDFD